MSLSRQQTVGIAGAGVMGRVLAWRLQQAGFNVTLFDRDCYKQGNVAGYTAAGMLTPYCEVESADLAVYHLGMQSLQLWQAWRQQLGDLGYHDRGSLVVSHANDKADFHHFQRHLQRKLSSASNESVQHYQLLNQQGLMGGGPILATTFQEAIALPTEAWLCPHKTLSALAKALLENGAKWYESCIVTQVVDQKIIVDECIHSFDWVIDSRGFRR